MYKHIALPQPRDIVPGMTKLNPETIAAHLLKEYTDGRLDEVDRVIQASLNRWASEFLTQAACRLASPLYPRRGSRTLSYNLRAMACAGRIGVAMAKADSRYAIHLKVEGAAGMKWRFLLDRIHDIEENEPLFALQIADQLLEIQLGGNWARVYAYVVDIVIEIVKKDLIMYHDRVGDIVKQLHTKESVGVAARQRALAVLTTAGSSWAQIAQQYKKEEASELKRARGETRKVAVTAPLQRSDTGATDGTASTELNESEDSGLDDDDESSGTATTVEYGSRSSSGLNRRRSASE